MEKAIRKLNRQKAEAGDHLLNEYFLEAGDIIAAHLTDIFNLVFNSGHFPDAWTEGFIVPLYKNKGDKNDTNNYRGITLVSCLGKCS